MQTPSRKPHRRSREELRLEQIAIWGDAAYNTRHTTAFTPVKKVDPLQSPRKVHHLDLEALEEAVVAEGMEMSTQSNRGSFSMCHSKSAEVFRRSGSYAAVARASFKDKLTRRLPDVETFDVPRVTVTKRSGVSTSSREHWMDAVTRGRRSGKRDAWDDDQFFQTRRESAVIRERDEDNFRNSNAKLPEREDDDSSGHLHLRRARASMTMLGRYNRTRSSQLRPRSRNMLLADNSVETRS